VEEYQPRRTQHGRAAAEEEKRIYRKERKKRKKESKNVLRYAHVRGEEQTIVFTTKDTKGFVGCASRTGQSRNISRKACPEQRRRDAKVAKVGINKEDGL